MISGILNQASQISQLKKNPQTIKQKKKKNPTRFMGTFIFGDMLFHLKIYNCCHQVNFSNLIKHEQKIYLRAVNTSPLHTTRM